MQINGKKYDVRSGDVFVSNSTGTKMYIDRVSRGDAFYHTDSEDSSTMVMVEKLFIFCSKRAA